MSDHEETAGLLPVYASGQLDEPRRAGVERHLAGCAECRADLALWKAVAGEIAAVDGELAPPSGLAERALEQVRPARRGAGKLPRAWQLLRAQAPLVRREIWPASAAIIAIGYVVAVLAQDGLVIQALAPLMAAASIALIYGPENDPAAELALSTPTSPRQILLARLALVFGYDLALVLAASLALLPFLPGIQLDALILGWLGPMAFLSASALLLSMWIRAENAITVSYAAWLAKYLAGWLVVNPYAPADAGALRAILDRYVQFWDHPVALLGLSALLAAAALWSAGRVERNSTRWA